MSNSPVRVIGYPAHAVDRIARWTNEHGATFLVWRSQCGKMDTTVPARFQLLSPLQPRAGLCGECFPGQDPRRPLRMAAPVEVATREEVAEDGPEPETVRVILFKPQGKYYTEETWRRPDGAIIPADMQRSPDFRRISGGPVLITSDTWGYPHLFPGEPE